MANKVNITDINGDNIHRAAHDSGSPPQYWHTSSDVHSDGTSLNQVPAHNENVDHPQHYGGKDNPYEAIKVIEAWDLGFNLGNTIKYISRCGKKPGQQLVQDLQKALWYLQREIDNIQK